MKNLRGSVEEEVEEKEEKQTEAVRTVHGNFFFFFNN